MTEEKEETESKWSEMRFWVGTLTASVVFVLSIVWFSSVGQLIVREDGSIAKGSKFVWVYHYLAPRIQGQRFWREQLTIVRKQLIYEKGAILRYATQIEQRQDELSNEIRTVMQVAEERPDLVQSIDPMTERVVLQDVLTFKVEEFSKDVKEINQKIREHPERYRRLEAIERAILKRLEK